MDKLTIEDIKKLMDGIGVLMRENKIHLCEIDAKVGDGDLGLTMSAGFTKAAEAIADDDGEDVGKLLAKAGMTLASAAPSTMGTLMGTGFMGGGKAVVGKTEMGAADLATFWDAFVKAQMKRGKAVPGEKTIIDAMFHAAKRAKEASTKSLAECARAAEAGAREGLTATIDMMSTHGKAAVFREKTLGFEDPGATAGHMLVKAFADYIDV